MDITLEVNDKVVYASVPIQRTSYESEHWFLFIHSLVPFAAIDRQAYLFTLAPQRYSLGYEFSSYKEFKHGESKVLMNHFESVSDQTVRDIIESEEFERGLLKIVISMEEKTFDDLRFVIGDFSNVMNEVITLADDNSSLYWYNPSIKCEKIEAALKNFIT